MRANPRGTTMENDRHPVDIHIGRRIYTKRVTNGITQKVLAESAGVTFQQIQKYERGVNRLTGGRLWDIARALNTTPAYFFEGLADSSESPVADRGTDDRDLLLLGRYFRILNDRTKGTILALLRAMACSGQSVEIHEVD